MSQDTEHMWRLAAQYSSVGIEMVTAVGLGAWLGHGLDQHLGWSPYGLLGGFGMGCGAAFLALRRISALRRSSATQGRVTGAHPASDTKPQPVQKRRGG